MRLIVDLTWCGGGHVLQVLQFAQFLRLTREISKAMVPVGEAEDLVLQLGKLGAPLVPNEVFKSKKPRGPSPVPMYGPLTRT